MNWIRIGLRWVNLEQVTHAVEGKTQNDERMVIVYLSSTDVNKSAVNSPCVVFKGIDADTVISKLNRISEDLNGTEEHEPEPDTYIIEGDSVSSKPMAVAAQNKMEAIG